LGRWTIFYFLPTSSAPFIPAHGFFILPVRIVATALRAALAFCYASLVIIACFALLFSFANITRLKGSSDKWIFFF
jgi:hypothetical protein